MQKCISSEKTFWLCSYIVTSINYYRLSITLLCTVQLAGHCVFSVVMPLSHVKIPNYCVSEVNGELEIY